MDLENVIDKLSGIFNLSPAFVSKLSDAATIEIYQPRQVIVAAGGQHRRL